MKFGMKDRAQYSMTTNSALGGATMASIILNKEDRLAYIKELANQQREEKLRARALYEQDNELREAMFGTDTDFMSIENLDGITVAGIQKISGGVRYIPVIID